MSSDIGPPDDASVKQWLVAHKIPGIIDCHVHFMPTAVMDKVWAYFDAAPQHYGREWPITYRVGDERRIRTLSALGVRRFTTLNYAHRPGMASWLNDWSLRFARENPAVIASATFYPEPAAALTVATALGAGARCWKIHLQVSDFSPLDPLLTEAWQLVEDAGAPVVIHSGSEPLPGDHTQPHGVAQLLERHPELKLIVAHLGAGETDFYLDLARTHDGVYLDTAMALTDYMGGPTALAPRTLSKLEAAGHAGKIVFGSDFPNIPYSFSHQVEALARLGFGSEWMRAVLWDNPFQALALN